MKKRILLVVIIGIMLSCSETNKNKQTEDVKIVQTQNDTYLKATVDGVAFYTETPSNLSSLNNFTLLAADKGKNQKLKIFLDESKGPALYTIGEGKISVVYTSDKGTWIASRVRGKGSIDISKEGNYLKGKFSITCTSTGNATDIEITKGEFKVLNKNK